MKALVVLSGGMDSATALAVVRKDAESVACISFWYGSKHNDREGRSARTIANYYGVDLQRARLDFVAEQFASDLLLSGGDIPEGHYEDPSMKRTVVPFRNGIMLAIAAGYAESIGATHLVLGNHFGDHAVYPDCRASFAQAMATAIREGTYARIELLSPFQAMTKAEIVTQGFALDVPYALTYSCYRGQQRHCGKCGTCTERKEAFLLAGVPDPTEYDT